MFKRYKTKGAKAGAKALKRYHKSVKRKKLLKVNEYPENVMFVSVILSALCSIMIIATLRLEGSLAGLVAILSLILSPILLIKWLKGKIF